MEDKTQVNQRIGTNMGQAIAAGRDVVATQYVNTAPVEQVSDEQVQDVLAEIVTLIQQAALPADIKEEAETFAKAAKFEAKKPEPSKESIAGNLEQATKLLQNSSETVEAAGNLVDKLKGPVGTAAVWLGKALAVFLV